VGTELQVFSTEGRNDTPAVTVRSPRTLEFMMMYRALQGRQFTVRYSGTVNESLTVYSGGLVSCNVDTPSNFTYERR
jgi:hypothetical protein